MNVHPQFCDFTLETDDNERLASLCGQLDEHLRQVEQTFGVEINNRGNAFQVIGEPASARQASDVIKELYAETAKTPLTPARVHLILQQTGAKDADERQGDSFTSADAMMIQTRRMKVNVRAKSQRRYVANIRQYDITFGIGPAGTGKTYLAVACAVEALEQEKISRLILVRPAVEAGERLGFLPGDLIQKIDPYLRPLYDALYEMLGFERVSKLIERNLIEIAPLAYMRGRTLNDAFVILDEAQNTTIEQMKMFLTRIGFGSVAVITGDVTQVDLPRERKSGLRHAIEVLNDVDDIGFAFFKAQDVVRHPLVQQIVGAYERFDEKTKRAEKRKK